MKPEVFSPYGSPIPARPYRLDRDVTGSWLDPADVRRRLAEAPDDELRQLVADADLGARVRAKNRHAARQRRERTDHALTAAVDSIRSAWPAATNVQLAIRLLRTFGNHDAVDPLEALRLRISRLRRKDGRGTSLLNAGGCTVDP